MGFRISKQVPVDPADGPPLEVLKDVEREALLLSGRATNHQPSVDGLEGRSRERRRAGPPRGDSVLLQHDVADAIARLECSGRRAEYGRNTARCSPRTLASRLRAEDRLSRVHLVRLLSDTAEVWPRSGRGSASSAPATRCLLQVLRVQPAVPVHRHA